MNDKNKQINKLAFSMTTWDASAHVNILCLAAKS